MCPDTHQPASISTERRSTLGKWVESCGSPRCSLLRWAPPKHYLLKEPQDHE